MVHTACLGVNLSSVSGLIKILAIKESTSIDSPRLPCQPVCLILWSLLVLALVEVDFL
jgi:hypothetical protein